MPIVSPQPGRGHRPIPTAAVASPPAPARQDLIRSQEIPQDQDPVRLYAEALNHPEKVHYLRHNYGLEVELIADKVGFLPEMPCPGHGRVFGRAPVLVSAMTRLDGTSSRLLCQRVDPVTKEPMAGGSSVFAWPDNSLLDGRDAVRFGDFRRVGRLSVVSGLDLAIRCYLRLGGAVAGYADLRSIKTLDAPAGSKIDVIVSSEEVLENDRERLMGIFAYLNRRGYRVTLRAFNKIEVDAVDDPIFGNGPKVRPAATELPVWIERQVEPVGTDDGDEVDEGEKYNYQPVDDEHEVDDTDDDIYGSDDADDRDDLNYNLYDEDGEDDFDSGMAEQFKSIHFCTSNEVAQAIRAQFEGDVIVDDFSNFLEHSRLPLADEYSFYPDFVAGFDAVAEELLPVVKALENEGADVHIATYLCENGEFAFFQNDTYRRFSNPDFYDADNEEETADDDAEAEVRADDTFTDNDSVQPENYATALEDVTTRECGSETRNVVEHDDIGARYPRPVLSVSKAGPRLKRLDVLPPVLMETARALADNIQVAVEGVVAFMLAVLGAVLQGRLAIQPKPDPFYLEHLNLYVLVSMSTSSRKSAILKRLMMPLLALQARMMLEAVKAKALAERALEEVKAKLEQEQDLDPAEADFLYAHKDDLERQLLRTGQFIVQDMTPESLAKMLHSEGALLLRMDEVHIPTLLGSRWGNANNQTLLLQCYTGEAYTVNRVSSEPMNIVNPLLTIAAGTQPSVVEQLMNDDEFVLRGGAGRFLFVTPHSTFGERTYESPPVPEPVWAAYEGLIATLGALPMNRQEPQRLLLADDAQARISKFFIETDRKLEQCANDPKMSGLLGKLIGTTNRIAGILHAVRYADENAGLDRPVSAETMADAIELARFFAAHAEAAMSSARLGMNSQRAVWEKVRKEGLEIFQASELWQKMKGSRHFKVMAELDKALQGLSDRNFLLLRPTAARLGAAGRIPSREYQVNPRALALDDDSLFV